MFRNSTLRKQTCCCDGYIKVCLLSQSGKNVRFVFEYRLDKWLAYSAKRFDYHFHVISTGIRAF